MPELALILCCMWAVLLFIVRSVVQWRTTGSAGFNGFSGRPGSLEWFAGACATAGLLLTPTAAIAALLHWPTGGLWFSHAPTHYFGFMLAIIGIVGALVAQLTMGSSWRIGVNSQERTELITSGLFRWMRNPIFTFIGLSMIGFVLIVPNLPAMLAAVLGIVGIQLQVRYVEEPYLRATHGQVYERYLEEAARFIPSFTKR